MKIIRAMSRPIRAFLVSSFVCVLVCSVVCYGEEVKEGVSYDRRSLIINGRRELLFSGSVHYPRSPPEVLLQQVMNHFSCK